MTLSGRFVFVAATSLATTASLSIGAHAEQVTLKASDGVKVFGAVSRAIETKPPVILCFHMAGSNAAEYAPIAPTLVEAGFTVLAIDQRSGGSAFGARNQTVEVLGHSATYSEALTDLEAALTWSIGEAKGSPILVWGSSYSAALVFILAAKHPGTIAGVLSFSPGEYLGTPDAVRTAARKVTVPIFVTQANNANEISAARSIMAATATPTADKVQFLPNGSGVHGSSSLRQDTNATGAPEYWSAVKAFLNRFKQ